MSILTINCVCDLQLLALGNQIGKITIWDMTTEDASKSKCVFLNVINKYNYYNHVVC